MPAPVGPTKATISHRLARRSDPRPGSGTALSHPRQLRRPPRRWLPACSRDPVRVGGRGARPSPVRTRTVRPGTEGCSTPTALNGRSTTSSAGAGISTSAARRRTTTPMWPSRICSARDRRAAEPLTRQHGGSDSRVPGRRRFLSGTRHGLAVRLLRPGLLAGQRCGDGAAAGQPRPAAEPDVGARIRAVRPGVVATSRSPTSPTRKPTSTSPTDGLRRSERTNRCLPADEHPSPEASGRLPGGASLGNYILDYNVLRPAFRRYFLNAFNKSHMYDSTSAAPLIIS